MLGVALYDVNKADKHGMTALMLASQRGHERIKNIILLKQVLNAKNFKYTISYTKSLFGILSSYLGILYSLLKELGCVLIKLSVKTMTC